MDLNIDPNHDQLNYTRVGWVNEPSGRGTLSILISCVSTLLLCSLSVMHLNVPPKHTSLAASFQHYGYWCIIGIIGPEMVIWVAWRQFISARELKEQLRKGNVSPNASTEYFALVA